MTTTVLPPPENKKDEKQTSMFSPPPLSCLWKTSSHVGQLFFFNFFRKHIVLMVTYVSLCIITFGLQILFLPKILASALDATLSSSSHPHQWLWKYYCRLFPRSKKTQVEFFQIVFLPSLTILLLVFFFFLKSQLDAYLPIAHMKFVREYLYKSTLHDYQSSWKTISIGIFMSRYNALPREARYFVENVMSFWPILLLFLFIFGFLCIYDMTSALLFISWYMVFYVLFGKTSLGKKCIEKAYQRAVVMLQTTDQMSQVVMNMDHIFINQQEEQSLQENRFRENRLQSRFYDTATYNNRVIFLGTLMSLGAFVTVMYRAFTLRHQSTRIPFSQFFLTFTYFQTTFLTFLPRLISIIQGFTTILVYYQSLPSSSLPPRSSSTSSIKEENENMWTFPNYKISFQKVHFSYPSKPEIPILQDLNWDVPAGKKVMILAPSGKGKSTLLKLLFRFYSPTAGTIFIASTPLSSISTKELRSHIAYLTQNTHLFPSSILENIQYGNENVTFDEIRQLIQTYQFHRVLGSDLEKSCGYEGKDVSLGMQKIILLCRSVWKWKRSKIILLDEPFAGLDEMTRRSVGKLLQKQIQTHQTVIISNHVPLSSLGIPSSFFHEIFSWNSLLSKPAKIENKHD